MKKQNGTSDGCTQAYWSGATTLELAKTTVEFLKQDIRGLYHLCPKEKISKFNLLELFSKVWNKEIQVTSYYDNKSNNL